MKVRYVGPHAEVTIAATGQTVARGDTVEVSARLAAALCEQATWEPVRARKEKRDG